MSFRRVLSIIVLGIALAVLGTGSVAAAPTGSKNAEPMFLICDGVTYFAASVGNGPFATIHITGGGTGSFTPVAWDYTVYEAGEPVFSDTVTKEGDMTGRQDEFITCQFSTHFQDGGHYYTVAGTVTGTLALKTK